MMALILLAQTTNFDPLNLGAAGIMGMMWLFERRESNKLTRQLADAHSRIMSDREAFTLLIDVVQQNSTVLGEISTVMQHCRRETPPASGP